MNVVSAYSAEQNMLDPLICLILNLYRKGTLSRHTNGPYNIHYCYRRAFIQIVCNRIWDDKLHTRPACWVAVSTNWVGCINGLLYSAPNGRFARQLPWERKKKNVFPGSLDPWHCSTTLPLRLLRVRWSVLIPPTFPGRFPSGHISQNMNYISIITGKTFFFTSIQSIFFLKNTHIPSNMGVNLAFCWTNCTYIFRRCCITTFILLYPYP